MSKEMEIRLPWSVFYTPSCITVVCIQAWLHHCCQCTHLVTSSWTVYTPSYVMVSEKKEWKRKKERKMKKIEK